MGFPGRLFLAESSDKIRQIPRISTATARKEPALHCNRSKLPFETHDRPSNQSKCPHRPFNHLDTTCYHNHMISQHARFKYFLLGVTLHPRAPRSLSYKDSQRSDLFLASHPLRPRIFPKIRKKQHLLVPRSIYMRVCVARVCVARVCVACACV